MVVELLIRRGADADATDVRGRTALALADASPAAKADVRDFLASRRRLQETRDGADGGGGAALVESHWHADDPSAAAALADVPLVVGTPPGAAAAAAPTPSKSARRAAGAQTPRSARRGLSKVL